MGRGEQKDRDGERTDEEKQKSQKGEKMERQPTHGHKATEWKASLTV